MGRIVYNPLFDLVKDFLTSYLPNIRKSSRHTIRSYQKTLEMFFDFVKVENSVKLRDVTFQMINKSTLENFILHLEKVRGCSVKTRNQRLTCIRSFYSYASENDITVVSHWDDLKRVKSVPAPDEPVEHMSEAAITAILSQPDTSTEKGLRDMFIMLFLYQTGARVQELVDIRICDIRMGRAPTVTLHGKWGKIRPVPLREKAVEHLKKYIATFHPSEGRYSTKPLIFVNKNGGKKRMSEDNVRRLVSSYGAAARNNCAEVPDNVHPHLFRHSRAMHLYQGGIDLMLISQWLGHSKMETTLIYAHADTELKRKAIEEAIKNDASLSEHINSERYKVDDDEVLKQLYGLK